MKTFLSILLASIACSTAFAAETPDFNRDVRPILSKKCYACHGPDEKARKAKLRLDNYQDATTAPDETSTTKSFAATLVEPEAPMTAGPPLECGSATQ